MSKVRLEMDYVMCDGETFEDSIVRYDKTADVFYVEFLDREYWRVVVTPEKLRAIADFIEEHQKRRHP